MAKIGIFYGSSTGNTELVAEKIREAFGKDKADLLNVDEASVDDVLRYTYLVFGTSTWGVGDMQDDWEDFAEELKEADLKGRKIALFGVGDQDTYPESFADGMGTLYARLKKSGAGFVGEWPVDGYIFDDSNALKGKKFVGLPLDLDNQDDLTDERIKKWLGQLKKVFK